MASQLYQVVSFVGVAPAGIVALPHGINANGTQYIPDRVEVDNGDFAVISVTATTVTVQNNGAAMGSCDVLLELWHSIQRELGPDTSIGNFNAGLTPRPFIVAAGGGGGGGASIGGTVTGATAGSILFIGVLSVLAQDNSALFYDDSTNRLGLGSNTPGTTLDISDAGTTAALAMRAGSTAAVSAANTGRLRYNESTQTFQISQNGAAYLDVATGTAGMSIGGTVTSGTTGSILFVGAGPVLSQDNANFFWDDTNNRLGIGNAAPAQALHVTGTGRFSAGLIVDAFTPGSVIFAGTAGALSQDNAALFYDDSTNRLGLGSNTPGATLDISDAGTTAALAMRAGSTAAVSAANTGRLRYNESTQTFQISQNGAAYLDVATGTATMSIGGTVTSGTTGSILFVGAGPVLSQDNANLFWDDGNNRLGIGIATPTYQLDMRSGGTLSQIHVAGNVATDTGGFISAPGTDQISVIGGASWEGGTTFRAKVSTAGGIWVQGGDTYFYGNTSLTPAATYTPTARMIATADGGFIFLPSTAGVSGAANGKLRFNSGTNTLQLSILGGAYVDVATTSTTMAIGGTITSATAGSVLFAGTSGILQQDNANFFWDDGNNRLGLGTTAPGVQLHINQTTSPKAQIKLTSSGLGSWSAMCFAADNSSTGFDVDYDGTNWKARNATVALLNKNGGFFSIQGSSGNSVGGNAGTGNILGIDLTSLNVNIGPTQAAAVKLCIEAASTSAAIQMGNGGSTAVSASSTGRLIYNTSGQVFQISKNAAAYETLASLATAQTFTKSQNVALVTLTDAATIATDASLGNVFKDTLTGNRTLGTPTNLVSGGRYTWIIQQSTGGANTLAYAAIFKFPGAVAPVITVTANAVDKIEAVYDGTNLLCTFAQNFS